MRYSLVTLSVVFITLVVFAFSPVGGQSDDGVKRRPPPPFPAAEAPTVRPMDISPLIREHKISYTYLPAMSNNGQYLVVICKATVGQMSVEAIRVVTASKITAAQIMEAHEAARNDAILTLVGDPGEKTKKPAPQASR